MHTGANAVKFEQNLRRALVEGEVGYDKNFVYEEQPPKFKAAAN